MYNFLAVLLFLYTTLSESRFLTNSGCICALSKSTILTPNASATSVAGCSTKMDWTGINSTWCLTDQTVPCGTYKPLYGYADTCSAVSLTSTFTPPVILQPDQTSNIFYTGQILTIGWTSTNILNDEFLKLSYQGTGGLRTLTSGSGVNITTRSFSTRISDSANSLATNTSLLLSTTSPTLSLTLNPPITILQSKLINITVYDGSRLITTGSSIVCDNRTITVNWVGIGEAQIGNATVTIKSSFGGGGGGGGGTTVGTPVLTTAQSFTSVNYTCPRSFTPGFGGTTYTAQLSVQSPGVGVAPYTLSSISFSLTAAPTQTPTSSLTPTQTPTPSLSFGASASITPSITPTGSSTTPATPSTTPTSSMTPTSSITPTSTVSQSPQASVDLGAIANAATAGSMALLSAVLGGLGGFLGLSILIYVAYRLYQRHEFRKRRLARRKGIYDQTVIKNERETLYGIQTVITENPQPMVMYQSPASKNAGLGRQASGRQGSNRRVR